MKMFREMKGLPEETEEDSKDDSEGKSGINPEAESAGNSDGNSVTETVSGEALEGIGDEQMFEE
jgi:hypothetical protein